MYNYIFFSVVIYFIFYFWQSQITWNDIYNGIMRYVIACDLYLSRATCIWQVPGSNRGTGYSEAFDDFRNPSEWIPEQYL
jgi:hypothetical protein